MNITNAKWTPGGNVLIITCECGARIEHDPSQRRVDCPKCKRRAYLDLLRDKLTRDWRGEYPKDTAREYKTMSGRLKRKQRGEWGA